jgi:hypothetical protein
MNDNEELAIIERARFGVNDRGWVGLSFGVKSIRYGAGQFLNVNETADLLKRHEITDINHLNGKPCIIEIDGDIMRFVDLWK